MNLSHLYYFRTLASYEHFTKAAKNLYIAQSTLSNAMATIENELGISLFEKTGRRVKLTKDGREFQHSVIRSLRILDQAITCAQEHTNCLNEIIEIGTVYTIQNNYLPALIRGYRKAYGLGLEMNLSQGLTLPLLDGLENGKYDIIFAGKASDHPEITFVPILSQQLVAVVRKDHPFARRNVTSICQISEFNYPIITYRSNTFLGNQVDPLVQNLKVTHHADDEMSIGSLVDASSNAIGIALNTLGISAFRELTPVLLSDVPKNFHAVCLAYRPLSYKTHAVETFIQFAKDFSNQYQSHHPLVHWLEPQKL